MNFVNRSLAGGRTSGRVGASGVVGASLLTASVFPVAPASLYCSPRMSARGLTQGLQQVVRDPKAIAKVESLIVILLNGLADPLGMELLEL